MFYRPTLERLENRNIPAAINMWTSILHTNDETGSVENVEVISRETNIAVSNPESGIPGQYLIIEAAHGYQIFHANNGQLTVQFVTNGIVSTPTVIINNIVGDFIGSANWIDDKIIVQAELLDGKIASAWTSSVDGKVLTSVITDQAVYLLHPIQSTIYGYDLISASPVDVVFDDYFFINELGISAREHGPEFKLVIQNEDLTFTIKTLISIDEGWQWKIHSVEKVDSLTVDSTMFLLYKDTI